MLMNVLGTLADSYPTRDALIKLLQNSSLVFAKGATNRNENLEKKMRALHVSARDARKSFYVFKIFRDVKLIQSITGPKPTMIVPAIEKKLLVHHYSHHLLNTLFETLDFYCRLKVIPGNNPLLTKTYNYFWITSIFSLIAKKLYDLNEYRKEKKRCEREKDEKGLKAINLRIKLAYLEIFSNFNDLFNCTTGAGVAKKLFGFDFCDYTVGITGSTAAIASITLAHLNSKI